MVEEEYGRKRKAVEEKKTEKLNKLIELYRRPPKPQSKPLIPFEGLVTIPNHLVDEARNRLKETWGEEEFDEKQQEKASQTMWEMRLKRGELASDYFRQVTESDGFDVDFHILPPRPNEFITVFPLSPSDIEKEKLAELSELAIEFYNTKKRHKTKYVFDRLAYATTESFTRVDHYFYLTFYATPKQQHQDDDNDNDNGLTSSSSVVFEARVYRKIASKLFGDPVTRVELCRIKAPPKVEDVQVVGDAVVGNVIKGVGHYLGGNQGSSKFEWFRLDSNTRDRVLVLTGSADYTLTAKDVGHRLIFKYTPVNSVGQEGKPRSKWSQIVKPGNDVLSEVGSSSPMPAVSSPLSTVISKHFRLSFSISQTGAEVLDRS